MIKRLTLLTLVLAFAATPALAQTCADIHGDPGCAPSPLDGTVVTVTGIVYVEAGTYNSGSVYFQCPDGGLTFFDSAAAGVLFEGDEVEVTGTVGAFNDEIQLNGATYTTLSTGNAAVPVSIGTGDLADGTDQLANFMKVQGTLGGSSPVYTVDDGTGPVIVFIDSTTGIDTAVLDGWVGDIVSVQGSTKCFNGEGEILPRRDGDIELITVPTEESSFGQVKASYDE